jgi:hypothetical protein
MLFGMLASKEERERRYKIKDTPWDAQAPDPYLVSLIERNSLVPEVYWI